MAELKTKKNDASVHDFIERLEHEQKKADAHDLVTLFEQATGEKATMRGDSIIGFGAYHYKSERSTQEGDRPLTGFSPRKNQISIYIMPGVNNYTKILKNLGKHKLSKGSCLYIKKLADIDTKILTKLITTSVNDMKKAHEIS